MEQHYPWARPTDERTAQLLSRPIRVMYFSDQPNPGSFRYRVYNMICALQNETVNVSAEYFTENDGAVVMRLVKDVDRLVIHRTLYTDFAARLILNAKRFGVPVFYDIDDYVFDEMAVPELVHSLDKMPFATDRHIEYTEWNAWFGWASRYKILMAKCEKVIVTTEYLAHLVASVTGEPTIVVPNFLSYEELSLSEELYQEKLKSGLNSNGLRIGYFSGTASHQRDLALAAPGIKKFLSEQPNSTFHLVGYGDLERAGLGGQMNQIKQHDLVSYAELPKLIAEVDVNIAPLTLNNFTNSKSELKYFSAAAVGTPTIASPTSPMKDAIDSGSNGWLANADDWYETLCAWADSALADYQKIVVNAHDDALAHFTPKACIGQLLSALELSEKAILAE